MTKSTHPKKQSILLYTLCLLSLSSTFHLSAARFGSPSSKRRESDVMSEGSEVKRGQPNATFNNPFLLQTAQVSSSSEGTSHHDSALDPTNHSPIAYPKLFRRQKTPKRPLSPPLTQREEPAVIFKRLREVKIREHDGGNWWCLWLNKRKIAGRSLLQLLNTTIMLRPTLITLNPYLKASLQKQKRAKKRPLELPLYYLLRDLIIRGAKRNGIEGYSEWNQAKHNGGWQRTLLEQVDEALSRAITAQRLAIQEEANKKELEQAFILFFGQANWDAADRWHLQQKQAIGTLVNKLTRQNALHRSRRSLTKSNIRPTHFDRSASQPRKKGSGEPSSLRRKRRSKRRKRAMAKYAVRTAHTTPRQKRKSHTIPKPLNRQLSQQVVLALAAIEHLNQDCRAIYILDRRRLEESARWNKTLGGIGIIVVLSQVVYPLSCIVLDSVWNSTTNTLLLPNTTPSY